MTETYKPYHHYKESNIAYLGQVPAHWETWKVTHGFDLIGSGTTPKSDNPIYYDGEIPWVTTSELRESVIYDTNIKVTDDAINSYSALKKYPKDSIAIAMYGATIGRLGQLGIEATFNQACCVFSYPKVFVARFFYYWLWMRRPILISLSNGGGQPNLSQDDLKKLWIPIPNKEEQQKIADFLDYKTAQIDALIAKKETLLLRLQEKRSALITQAVTKGINPNVPMKPSGVEWLGDVPTHWETWKVTHGFDLIGSGTTPKSDNPIYYDGEIPWVTTSELRESVIYDTNIKVTDDAINSYSALKKYPKDSIAIAMYGATIGRLGQLGIEATFNQACCVFSYPKVFVARFFYYWLWMRRPILISLSNGGGQPNLSQDDLKKLWIPIPNKEEQQKIADFLDFETNKLELQKVKVLEVINKLNEYKAALITNAVTGKIDVREFNIPEKA
jgi:type I restriction enzyme, S subunit